jgi:hypothetical protein
MSDTYLSADELRELTGCAHRARQRAWLDANRWPYAVAATGHIRVLREYWRARLTGAQPVAPSVHAERAHNFAAIEGIGDRGSKRRKGTA